MRLLAGACLIALLALPVTALADSVVVTARVGDETGVFLDSSGAYHRAAGTTPSAVSVERRGRTVIVTVVPQ
jgi:hypothetical protein